MSTWGPEGPPDEAYSRVTRDLAAVTAEYDAWLDALPSRLVADYRCHVRPTTPAEEARLGPVVSAYAVEPDDAACATLLVGRFAAGEHGETLAVLAFGEDRAQVIDCLCDACDTDSAGLIEEGEQFLAAVLGGVREYRRLDGRLDHVRMRPWYRDGMEASSGLWESGRTRHERGVLEYDHTWAAWPRR